MSKRKEPAKGARSRKSSSPRDESHPGKAVAFEEPAPTTPAESSDAPSPESPAAEPQGAVPAPAPVVSDTAPGSPPGTRPMSESKPAQGDASATPPSANPKPSSGGLFPDWAGPRVRVATYGALGLLLVVSWSMPWLTRTAILARQRALPESVVPLALEDLEAGREAAALARVRRLLAGARILRFEGRGESAAAIEEQRLADVLASRGFRTEARAMSLRAALAYHQENRALEDLPTWATYARACAPEEPARMLSALEILLAHGRPAAAAAIARFEGVSDPFRARLAAWAETRRLLVNRTGDEAAGVAWPEWKPKEARTFGPAARCAIDAVRARALARAGRRDEARALAKTLRDAHPHRLEPEFLAAALEGGEAARVLLDSLDARADLVAFDMSGLEPAASPTLSAARLARRGPTGRVVATLATAGAMELRVRLDHPVERFDLVASGTDLLGVHPIVLVTVEGGETWPVHVSSGTPAPFAVEIPLAAGSHAIRIEYINDSAVRIGDATYDRNLTLHRIVFPKARDAGD